MTDDAYSILILRRHISTCHLDLHLAYSLNIYRHSICLCTSRAIFLGRAAYGRARRLPPIRGCCHRDVFYTWPLPELCRPCYFRFHTSTPTHGTSNPTPPPPHPVLEYESREVALLGELPDSGLYLRCIEYNLLSCAFRGGERELLAETLHDSMQPTRANVLHVT